MKVAQDWSSPLLLPTMPLAEGSWPPFIPGGGHLHTVAPCPTRPSLQLPRNLIASTAPGFSEETASLLFSSPDHAQESEGIENCHQWQHTHHDPGPQGSSLPKQESGCSLTR